MGKIYNRKTKEYYEDVQYKGKVLSFLYNTIIGRIILKSVILSFFSKWYGKHYDSKKSASKIDDFIKENSIDMSLYEKEEYNSFNDFFTRKKIITEDVKNNFCKKNIFISPADSKLLCYKISESLKVKIKESEYDLEELIASNNVHLNNFKNGNVFVFRLSVDDYHRFCFVDDGEIKESYEIKGKLHTVSSISKRYKIYKENHRIVNLLETKNMGDIYFIEVGALLVGKIINHNITQFHKGDEKGYFKYGGSTIVIITKDNLLIDKDIVENSKNGIETKVEYGEKIGTIKEN